MNKPITLCDRCKEYARCCLNYDGDNCRRSRTVEPTNADRIRAMSDEELRELLVTAHYGEYPPWERAGCIRDWLKQEAK